MFDRFIKNRKKIKVEYLAVIISIVSLLIALLKLSSYEEANIISYLTFLAALLGSSATVVGAFIAYTTINEWKVREDWAKNIEIAEKFLETILSTERSFGLLTFDFANKNVELLEYFKNIVARINDIANLNNNIIELRAKSELAKRFFPKDDSQISIEIKKIQKYGNEMLDDINTLMKSTYNRDIEMTKLTGKYSDKKDIDDSFEALKEVCYKYLKPAKSLGS